MYSNYYHKHPVKHLVFGSYVALVALLPSSLSQTPFAIIYYPRVYTGIFFKSHIGPDMHNAMKLQAFILSIDDYLAFDEMLIEWNKNASRRERVYIYVDPRRYDWRKHLKENLKRRTRTQVRLRAKPPIWIYCCGTHTSLARLLRDDMLSRHALVVGLARPSTTFNPSLLLYGKRDPASTNSSWIGKGSLFLLRQLAHHCDQEETRSGYIMTEEEFTACRFYDMPSTAAGTAGTDYQDVKERGAELVRIPWRHSCQDVELTTDLALWWLCMKRLSQLENGDPTRTGSQETHDTEQFPRIPHQGLHVGFNAQMPVVPPPLQASENQLDVDGQSPDSEESDDMWGSEEQDPNLVTKQEEDTEIPSNQPPKMIDTAMEETGWTT